MYKSFKFRIYPNDKQLELLNKSFGCNRFIYNYYLSKIKNNGYKDAYSNISDYTNNLKYEYVFLQEVDSTLIRKTLFNLDDNMKKYYNNKFGYLKYKGKLFYQIDAYYPSSQECNVCGNIDKKYKNLNEREYKCSKCHNIIDRDLNASINIMFEGIKLYMKELNK